MKKEGGREANYKCVTSTTSRLTTGYSSQSHTSSTTCYGTIEFHQLKNRYEYLFHARFREHHAQSSQQHLVTLTLIAACLQIQSDITLSIQLIKRQQEPVPRPTDRGKSSPYMSSKSSSQETQ